MHQAGLRVPAADGARLPVFRRVMADIGDEQSIAQSLSTFSSHLRNVVRFVADAGPATLVLLDEVGAGTDPAEGSALAMAIVSRLLDAGSMVAATTHYAELKAFATEHPGVTNAAVEFDVATLRPTYRLTIGLPGKSQAFAIADRLGLPEPILADARTRISAEHASMEETLAAIAAAERAQAAALEAASAERASAADERELARTGVAQARREAAKLLAEARRAADELVARAEREVADLRREMTRQRNLAGGRRGASAPAVEDLSRRAARARSETAVAARGRWRMSPRQANSRASACSGALERWAAPGASSRSADAPAGSRWRPRVRVSSSPPTTSRSSRSRSAARRLATWRRRSSAGARPSASHRASTFTASGSRPRSSD